MLALKSFRYRIYPDRDQAARLLRWEHSLRFLWNIAHEQRLLGLCRTKGERRFYSFYEQGKELTELRAELPWLADVPRDVSVWLLSQLDEAWQRCFKKLSATPQFKRRNSPVSFCAPHRKSWWLKGNRLHFPKLGVMTARVHRNLHGSPKTCTIRREGDQWFASVLCEIVVADPGSRIIPVVAIDRGLVNVVSDSEGKTVASPQFYSKQLTKLKRAQRAVSRKVKGSKNREKAKLTVSRIHRKIRRQRSNLVHNLSATYAKSHGTVVIERLRVRDMAHAARCLSRNIMDAGWGMLAKFLRYKLAWSGGELLEVAPHYSSQTCSACGAVDKASRKTQSLFWCSSCGMIANADLNAALILKSRANRSALPVEGSVPKTTLRSRKRLRVQGRTNEAATAVDYGSSSRFL